MIIQRTAIDQLRRRALDLGGAHGGVTVLLVGVLTAVWQRLAPVRTQVAAWAGELGERMPDGVPWVAVVVTATALTLAAVAVVLVRTRPRPAPTR